MIDPKLIYPNHAMLSYKNQGPSKALVGTVCLYVYLVDEEVNSWSRWTINRFENALVNAICSLEKQAKAHGVKLDLKYSIDRICLSREVDKDNWEGAVRAAIGKYSYKTVERFQNGIEKQFQYNDSAVILAINRTERSFATVETKTIPNPNECCVVYKDSGVFWGCFSTRTIMHEVLHQFGAHDLYYPKSVQDEALRCLGPNVMGGHGTRVDPLTAYLVGWTNRVDANTIKFLRNTSHWTDDALEAAKKREDL